MEPVVVGIIIGSVATAIWESIIYFVPYFKKNFWDNPKLILGRHIHHSVLGLTLIALGILLIGYNKKDSLIMIGIGFGIILIHTIFDGRLMFIEKTKKHLKNKL